MVCTMKAREEYVYPIGALSGIKGDLMWKRFIAIQWDYDSERAEIVIGFLSVAWGVWTAIYGSHVFLEPIYKDLALFLTTPWLASLLTIGGVVNLYAVLSNHLRLRRFSVLAGIGWYAFLLASCVESSSLYLLASPTLMVMIVASIFVYIRLLREGKPKP